MADETPKPLDYARRPGPTPQSELYPWWVLGMLWGGLAVGCLFVAAYAGFVRLFGWY